MRGGRGGREGKKMREEGGEEMREDGGREGELEVREGGRRHPPLLEPSDRQDTVASGQRIDRGTTDRRNGHME